MRSPLHPTGPLFLFFFLLLFFVWLEPDFQNLECLITLRPLPLVFRFVSTRLRAGRGSSAVNDP